MGQKREWMGNTEDRDGGRIGERERDSDVETQGGVSG